MSIIQGNSKTSAAGYSIDQSARFNDGDSPELSRTYTLSAPWTFSAWVKRCELGAVNILLGTSGSSPEIQFNSGDTITAEALTTTAVFRDPAAWYHVHVSDNGLYINGTSFGAVTTTSLTNAKLFDDFDGYVAEVHLQSGTSAYTNFGETNSDTGQWVPKAATAGDTYLKFANSSDFGENSGTGGAWTASNLTSADQMLDTPTDNFCTLSSVDKNSLITLSNGNLRATTSSGPWADVRGTLFATSGKWYYEWTPVSATYAAAGWSTDFSTDHTEEEGKEDTSYYRGVNAAGAGLVIGSASPITSVANFSVGDTIMMAIDIDTGDIWVGVNGTWEDGQDPGSGGTATGTWSSRAGYPITPWVECINIGPTTSECNFGQSGGFTYGPPTGFNAWSTANLSDPAIADPTDHFQTVLDTGANIKTTAEALYTDQFEWIKDRANANNHQLIDSVRGTSAVLQSNTTAAETTYSAPSGNSVGWVWKANGSGSSNTDGSITSTVSANTTSGFSVVTYTPGTGVHTWGHGLGVAPSMVIVKDRGEATNWQVYHQATGPTGKIFLNSTAAFATDSGIWNNTAPTSSVVTTGSGLNDNHSFVAYCFAEVEGFSKFGSYIGNGSSDGPFVYCGFRPSWVMFKRTDSTADWLIKDASGRDPYNVMTNRIYPNTTAGDDPNTTNNLIDFTSNGFKHRAGIGTGNYAMNASGSTYIYAAFAESPFKTANAR